KVMRVWDDKLTKEEMESLDYSSPNENIDTASAIRQNLVDENNLGHRSQDGSRLFSFFQNITGQKEITEEDLTLVLANMKEHLINKNVAADIATHLCDSVSRTLVGQKIGSFKSIRSTVKQSMESALKRILTPKTSVDLLRDISQAQSESRPYTICFIGVNGVGKSTNLSKTCFWLLQNGLKVLIAGCDTFRSGAVEQLKVHVRNLNTLGQNSVVELYERGYGKDAAGIAKDAINFAKANGFDVVLIDTAGRMQDNEPLMRALAKLVTVNNPDKIIFVGEALVGNEAVDQLTKFNQALKDFSGLQNPRHIDGIILTKFDTIDDKVGAALSMAYTTGQPILFVGTGQTYTDLKTMRVGHIVQALLKE
ncbi:989_t:CDS:2, partial [Racocetra persica]